MKKRKTKEIQSSITSKINVEGWSKKIDSIILINLIIWKNQQK